MEKITGIHVFHFVTSLDISQVYIKVKFITITLNLYILFLVLVRKLNTYKYVNTKQLFIIFFLRVKFTVM